MLKLLVKHLAFEVELILSSRYPTLNHPASLVMLSEVEVVYLITWPLL